MAVLVMIAIAGAIAIGLPITEATLITRSIAVAESVGCCTLLKFLKIYRPLLGGGIPPPPSASRGAGGARPLHPRMLSREARLANAARGLTATNTNKFYCN